MAQGIFNGKIVGNPWSVYTELTNRDIAPNPTDKRQDLSSYALRKRKSYRKAWAMSDLLGEFADYDVTDVWFRTNSPCRNCSGENPSDGCGCCRFYYAVNKSKTRYAIIRTMCDDRCNPVVIECGTRCPCATDQFFSIYGQDSPTRGKVVESSIHNVDANGYIYTSSPIVQGDIPKPGQYIQIVETTGTSICGTIRRILSVEEYKGKLGPPYDYRIQVDQLWPSVGTEILDGAGSIVFDDIDRVPGYVGQNGVMSITGCALEIGEEGNCNEDFSENEPIGVAACGLDDCIISAQEVNGLMTYVNNEGIMLYSSPGLNYNYIDGFEIVGKDVIDTAAFKGFLINFGKKSIDSVTFSNDLQSTIVTQLDSNGIGIKNKGAWEIFDGGLYFVGSDNRIYGASISTNGTVYDLSLEEKTTNVLGYLDNINEDDEVYLSSNAGVMYVFINSRQLRANTKLTDTTILKYYKDFDVWMVHEVCGQVIKGFKCGEFFGEGLYNYCSRDGDGDAKTMEIDEYGNPRYFGMGYEAKATGFIYGNGNHGMKSDDNAPLDMYRRHAMSKGTLLLGTGLYTDASRIEVVSADKYERYSYKKFDAENCRFSDQKKGRNCMPVEPSECFIDRVKGCKSFRKCLPEDCDEFDTRCNCEGERKPHRSFCVCYEGNKYEIAKVEAFNMEFDNRYGRYHEVSFVSGYGAYKKSDGSGWYHINDVGYLLGMVINTDSENVIGKSTDPLSIDCCEPAKKCD